MIAQAVIKVTLKPVALGARKVAQSLCARNQILNYALKVSKVH